MGLFDFFKKAGAKASGNKNTNANNTPPPPPPAPDIDANFEANLAAQKKQLINGVVGSLGVDIKNFDVDLSGNNVTVYGEVGNDDAAGRVISAIRNTDGVEFVDNRISVVAPAETFYEVKSGDSLSKIAKELYGNPGEYMKIFNANKDILKDPNLIHPGQKLRIPK